jgi:hypothetical protein
VRAGTANLRRLISAFHRLSSVDGCSEELKPPQAFARKWTLTSASILASARNTNRASVPEQEHLPRACTTGMGPDPRFTRADSSAPPAASLFPKRQKAHEKPSTESTCSPLRQARQHGKRKIFSGWFGKPTITAKIVLQVNDLDRSC